ncbi:DNA replication/repair protein RecF [Bifidobacterium stellenboschense]|uniref:DNA replication and repair protein RecF n=1 Tax=Bifidobacterium stellenboschense TaxID=762211 RepID=A0A087E0W4_9BIFI|nr:DNA replication and repair protein RecF [Bifidobacterium stellenboschense]KFJ01415.1 DNA repair protein RecF [Bifidobacterium stellenboschense]
MYVSRLALDHYRSWGQLVVDFAPGVNVLHGANGLGKTNIVEAVEVLSTGTSHRTSSSLPLVERGATKATIRANVTDGDGRAADGAAAADAGTAAATPARTVTYEATIAARGANRARVDAGPSRYLRDIVGEVPSVAFTPDDQRLVAGDPATRRNFLDQAGALLVPRYAERQQRFTRIARQRATLLKQLQSREGAFDATLSGLEIWTGQFIDAGLELTRVRAHIVDRLAGPFAAIYARLASGNGEAGLAYAPSFAEATAVPAGPDGDAAFDPRPAIAAHFQRLYAGEVARGVNLIGPQRDDLAVTLDGVPAREFASNGEMWTMALALKMALFEAVAEDRGVRPVVILDDVFAQLDESRREQILDFAMHQDQVLITVAAAGDIPAMPPSAAGRTVNVIDVGELRRAAEAGGDADAAAPEAAATR